MIKLTIEIDLDPEIYTEDGLWEKVEEYLYRILESEKSLKEYANIEIIRE